MPKHVSLPWDDDEEHNRLLGQTLHGWGRDGMWHAWGGVGGGTTPVLPSFLLLESGDSLLLESGDKTLLEDGN